MIQDNTGTVVVQLILATAGSGVLVTVIQGFFTRRKTRAEVEGAGAAATKTITDAAAGVVAVLQADNVALRAEMTVIRAGLEAARRTADQARTQLESLQDWRAAAEALFVAHGRWDAEVAARLRSGGVPVSDPPPLHPNLS